MLGLWFVVFKISMSFAYGWRVLGWKSPLKKGQHSAEEDGALIKRRCGQHSWEEDKALMKIRCG
jgi:hypothetical protein